MKSAWRLASATPPWAAPETATGLALALLLAFGYDFPGMEYADLTPGTRSPLELLRGAKPAIRRAAMRPVLERVPVMLVEYGELGVLGAAGWYLAHHHNE